MSTFPKQWVENVESTANAFTFQAVRAKFRDELYPRQRELEATPHTKADSVGEFFRMVFWEQVQKRVHEREFGKCVGAKCGCKEEK